MANTTIDEKTERLRMVSAAAREKEEAEDGVRLAKETLQVEVRRAHAADVSVAAIAEAAGLSRVTVYQIVKEDS